MQNDHSQPNPQVPRHTRYKHDQNSSRQAASLIDSSRSQIKAQWEEKVRHQIPVSKSQTSIVLINSMGIFLDDLVEALRQPATLKDDETKLGMSTTHGGQRARMSGYFLPQLLIEFNILREIIVETIHQADLLDFETRSVLDRVFDAAISLATTEFASVQKAFVQEALARAEASNRDLEHFAAVAAHDLKSPLATISGYLELLSEETGDQLEKKSLQYIDRMSKTAEQMRTLVDRLLEYASLATTKKPFQVVHVDDVLRAVLQNLHKAIEHTHAKIIWTTLPSVHGDFDLLVQLFQNLIANSLKFHGQKPPSIHIDSESREDMILFSLRDQGVGFDTKEKENIFSLYKKLDVETQQPGSGIGLATCRKVVELHKGKLWADSSVGHGATFFFTLPNANFTGVANHH